MRGMFSGAPGEYIKTPEQAMQAAQAATETWNVQTGKQDAWSMVEAVRQYNPERYQSIQQELARGLLAANPGWSLVKLNQDGTVAQTYNSAPQDPRIADIERKLSEYDKVVEQRKQADETAAQERSRADLTTKIDQRTASLTKGTFLEGDTGTIPRVLAQMDKNSVDATLAQTNYAEWEKQFDRAFKQVKNATLDQLRQWNKSVVQHRQRLRASSPASPGTGTNPKSQANDTTGQPQRSQFPEGEEGTAQWRSALVDWGFTPR